MRRVKSAERGFTLVELMIVVAIVGVLAALAIYGVQKYVKNAKTTEARAAVSRLAKDATTAYARPKMPGAVLAPGAASGSSVSLCASAINTVPTAGLGSVASQKYQSSASEWNSGSTTAGWACLRFSMSDPQYYMYSYTASGNSSPGDSFTAMANGDLDGDTIASSFSLLGSISANTNDRELLVSPNLIEVNPDE